MQNAFPSRSIQFLSCRALRLPLCRAGLKWQWPEIISIDKWGGWVLCLLECHQQLLCLFSTSGKIVHWAPSLPACCALHVAALQPFAQETLQFLSL
jgi:hypothetical protein